MKKQSLPMKSVSESIKSDEDFRRFLEKTKNPYLIRAFSIDNVNSQAEAIMVEKGYIEWWEKRYSQEGLRLI